MPNFVILLNIYKKDKMLHKQGCNPAIIFVKVTKLCVFPL